MTRIDKHALFAASITLFAAASYGEEFPNQAIRMIGPLAGGGIRVN